MTPRGNAALALGALAVLTALEVWRLGNPAPAGTTAGVEQFSAARAIDVLHVVGLDAPHTIATPSHAGVRERIVAKLEVLDYRVEVQRVFACNAGAQCGEVENIIARRPDDATDRKAVVIAAHYDSVPAGPGASDDGTGVASVLELARAVRHEAFANPIVFLIDDGEESGLLGAEGYVADPARGKAAAFVINLEARGTTGTPFLFETSKEQRWLVPIVAGALPHPITTSLFATIYDQLPNDTDLTVFKRAGRAGINFAYLGGVVNYHTPRDDFAHVDAGAVQRRGEQALAMLRAFGEAKLDEAAPGPAVWFDVFAAFIVWWPAGWNLWIAIAGLVIAAVASARRDKLAHVAIGLAAWLGGAVFAAVLGVALSKILAIHTGGAAFIPHPGAILAAAWTAGLSAALAIHGLARRRATFDAAIAGQAVGWLALGVALGVVLPGAAYIAIVPGAVLAVASALRPRIPEAAVALAGLIAAAVVSLPFALFGYDALGTPIVTGTAVMIGLACGTFAPLLGGTGGLGGRLALVSLAATVVLAIAALLAPAESAAHPAHVALGHVTDADTGAARWQTLAATPVVRALAPFAPKQVAPWLGANGSAEVAPAPALSPPPVAPTATITPGTPQPDGTRVITLDLASARQAPRLALSWKSDAELVGIKVNGVALPPRPARFHSYLVDGWHRVLIRGAAARVELTVRGTQPAEGQLSDMSFGLPEIGAPLAAVRDASGAVTIQDGDVTIVERHLAW